MQCYLTLVVSGAHGHEEGAVLQAVRHVHGESLHGAAGVRRWHQTGVHQHTAGDVSRRRQVRGHVRPAELVLGGWKQTDR